MYFVTYNPFNSPSPISISISIPISISYIKTLHILIKSVLPYLSYAILMVFHYPKLNKKDWLTFLINFYLLSGFFFYIPILNFNFHYITSFPFFFLHHHRHVKLLNIFVKSRKIFFFLCTGKKGEELWGTFTFFQLKGTCLF